MRSHLTASRERRDERGASAAEYAILVSLIAVVIIAGVTFFGQATSGLFQKTCDSVSSSTAGPGC
jgi:pilus assembly protein Flp/PilA